jgi:hypothetical protein
MFEAMGWRVTPLFASPATLERTSPVAKTEIRQGRIAA